MIVINGKIFLFYELKFFFSCKQDLLKKEECREWFVRTGKEMLTSLLQKANYVSVFVELIEFNGRLSQSVEHSPRNWKVLGSIPPNRQLNLMSSIACVFRFVRGKLLGAETTGEALNLGNPPPWSSAIKKGYTPSLYGW